MYTEERITWKDFEHPWESTQQRYLILKRKSEVIDKRAAGIILKCKNCYICKQKFEIKYRKEKNHLKVKHHCHYAVEYRGVAHTICN